MSIRLNGTTSGYAEIDAPAIAGNNTVTLPASGAGTLIATSDTGTVSTAMVADSAISSSKIADAAVGNAKLADGSVGTTKLASTSVTADKLSTGGVGTGVGYVRNGAASVSSGASFGHFTYQAPSGTRMLVQWGSTASSSTSALTTANFHTAFSTAGAPSVSCIVPGILFGFTRTVSIGTISTNNFEYQVRDQSNTAQANGIRWIAVGEAP